MGVQVERNGRDGEGGGRNCKYRGLEARELTFWIQPG
jgi:hypothetical protein